MLASSDVRAEASRVAIDRALEWYAAKLPAAHAQSVSGEQVSVLREALQRRSGAPALFETLITFAQAMYRLARAYEGVPDCNVGDAITASGTIAVAAPAAAWTWDPAVDVNLVAKLGLDELSAGIAKKQKENREGWWAHAQKNRAFIEQAAASCARTGLAVVFGAGHAFDLPLLDLARRFERLVLVDIHGAALEATTAAIFQDPALRARVELRVLDVTGVNRALVDNVEQLCAQPGTAQEVELALDGLCRSYRVAAGARLPLLPDGERADLLVSSCVLSQLALPQRAYARRLFEKRFGPLRPGAERLWTLPWRELELRLQQDHINALTTLADVAVLTSDTIAHHTALDAAGTERLTGEKILPLAVESLLERMPKFLRIDRHGSWRWDLFRADRRGHKGSRMDVEGIATRETDGSAP